MKVSVGSNFEIPAKPVMPAAWFGLSYGEAIAMQHLPMAKADAPLMQEQGLAATTRIATTE